MIFLYNIIAFLQIIQKALLTADPDISGFTDNQGKPEKNQALSEKRANAVMTYLKDKGIDEGRLTAAGYGETHPIATNKTAKGRAQNRRVELKLNY